MPKRVLFRDNQEQTAGDHNNVQSFLHGKVDMLAHDIIGGSHVYSGFELTKTAQAEVTVAVGRYYDQTGKQFDRLSVLTQSMIPYLAAVSTRYVAVSVYGVDNLTDTEVRDFLVNASTGDVDPTAVSMTQESSAILVFTPGAESVDPQKPPVPATHAIIGYVLVNTTSVVSVTMVTENAISTNLALAARAREIELFRDQVSPRVQGLSGDLSDLANQLRASTSVGGVTRLMQDVARLKASLRFPTNAAGYGAAFYLLRDDTISDTLNASGLGYDARVEEGVRFPNEAVGQSEISLFSANDPNASLSAVNGILLPKYESVLKLKTGDYSSDLGIAQYGFQTIETRTGYLSRTRIRYGGSRFVCSNGAAYDTAGNPPQAANLLDFTTEFLTQGVGWVDASNPNHVWTRYDTYWMDSWKEPYMYSATVNQTITGAQVAQTFLVSNDMWATKLGFFCTQKGAAENIRLVICEVENGAPNIKKSIMSIVYPHGNIVAGDWNRIDIPPTFFAKGKRLAVVFISNANHKIGMTSGQNYLDGTFFYSTDGQYQLGDLTKDMMLEVWGAQFPNAQVAVEFAPLSLSGGIRDIDILASLWQPGSTQLVFELRPNGTGAWLPITKDLATILATAPPLCQFRARFVGTTDMQPALQLTGSRVTISRPKLAFKEVTTIQACPATTNIVVTVVLEGFDNTAEALTAKLRSGGALANTTELAPASTVTTLLDASRQRYQKKFVFTPGAAITAFRVVFDGTTPSALNTFHIAEMNYYST